MQSVSILCITVKFIHAQQVVMSLLNTLLSQWHHWFSSLGPHWSPQAGVLAMWCSWTGTPSSVLWKCSLDCAVLRWYQSFLVLHNVCIKYCLSLYFKLLCWHPWPWCKVHCYLSSDQNWVAIGLMLNGFYRLLHTSFIWLKHLAHVTLNSSMLVICTKQSCSFSFTCHRCIFHAVIHLDMV